MIRPLKCYQSKKERRETKKWTPEVFAGEEQEEE